MVGGGTSWFAGALRFGRSQTFTQAAVLLPVVALAGLTAWTMLSAPTNARGASQPISQTVGQAAQTGAQAAAPVPVQGLDAAVPPTAAASRAPEIGRAHV